MISPDRSPNARAAELVGIFQTVDDWRDARESEYLNLLSRVRKGEFDNILVLGQRAVLEDDYDEAFRSALGKAKLSALLTPDASYSKLSNVFVPTLTANETEGIYVSANGHLQRVKRSLDKPKDAYSVTEVLAQVSKALKKEILPESVTDERSLYRFVSKQFSPLEGLSLMDIGETGVSLESIKAKQSQSSILEEA